jgi:hypothetical protein
MRPCDKICTVCRGLKFVIGVGYMREKCHNCDGLGYLIVSPRLEALEKAIESEKPKKRMGRPPKVRPVEGGDENGKIESKISE